MRVLLSILREMADLPDDPDRISGALNSLGLAVDSVVVSGESVAGVVTARILRTEKHPDAAKVTRCWVDAGDGVERHVWCGATNMGPGDIVPLATVGTVMPDGREIARRAIMGIDSEGMLCSGSELGLSTDSAGLLVMDPSTPIGRDPLVVLGIEREVVFEIDLTRNRPDCWGHAGVARDLAAHFSVAYRGPTLDDVPNGPPRSAPVTIVAGDRCAMFSAWTISGVVVGPSPARLVRRLELLGMRSINNVVDASNLSMLETNQPNHAYDAEVVEAFCVRLARPGETITTLDGQERTLHADDLLICDAVADTPVGLAGVMGDLTSEITASTTTLNLEIAWFDPDGVRFTAQRHGLRTEASIRFERGVDHNGHRDAARRFMVILRESCPDAVLHSAESVVTTDHLPAPTVIGVDADRVSALLGSSLDAPSIEALLSPIGFNCRTEGDTVHVVVPSWRPDCAMWVDIAEEVARHHGYERIGRTTPKSGAHGRLSTFQMRRRTARQVLCGLGLDEAMPSPFLAPGDLARAGLDESGTLRLANPLVAEESVLRTSLRPGMLAAAVRNASHRAERIALFEIGHVYPRGAGSLPDEAEWLCAITVGGGVEIAIRQWSVLSGALGVGAMLDQARVPDGLHPGRSASLTRGKTTIGHVGEIDPGVLHGIGLTGPVSCLECNLSVLLAEDPKPVQAATVNRLPSSDLDLAFIVPDEVTAGAIHRALRQAGGASLVSCVLFDSFRGVSIGEGFRSLAFRLRLQGSASTLDDKSLAVIRDACIAAAVRLGAQIRS
ncbi:MAG: phenylalanine--tRNA ligase subunit beta [Actinobacteria bacterium]|nr:phenylalanine--tRNA ligase subunit beta [Actinomycetota bacterium]